MMKAHNHGKEFWINTNRFQKYALELPVAFAEQTGGVSDLNDPLGYLNELNNIIDFGTCGRVLDNETLQNLIESSEYVPGGD